jgi:hypothetical protein
MSATEHTYERILAYLKGLLSNRQRHDLELEMMHDAFDEEAFEGLNQLTGVELEHDSSVLLNRLDKRIQPHRKRSMPLVLRIAATVVMLAGIGTILYFVFRTPSESLITQEITHDKENKAETATPSLPERQISVPETKATGPQQVSGVKQDAPVMVEISEQRSEEVSPINEKAKSATAKELASESALLNTASERQKSAAPMSSADRISTTGLLTGRIVGSDGEALPGVAVLEEGTDRGTVTDINGRFSLKMTDSNSMLAFNYIGYKSLEMNAREIAGKDIILQEDLLALDEVVVVGYGARKKSDEAGAVNAPEAKAALSNEAPFSYSVVNPIPPGGSLKAFKNQVNGRIDTTLFRSFPGRHKMMFILNLRNDGSVGNIEVRSSAPEPIIEAYKRAISDSPAWEPALQDDNPVESEVLIRFVVNVE